MEEGGAGCCSGLGVRWGVVHAAGSWVGVRTGISSRCPLALPRCVSGLLAPGSLEPGREPLALLLGGREGLRIDSDDPVTVGSQPAAPTHLWGLLSGSQSITQELHLETEAHGLTW